jgi:predicted GIY-YIG superfamily endonuclease
MKPFFVYMLRCSDKSYYVGHTDNIAKRLSEHRHGIVKGYTQTRLPVKLVYVNNFGTRNETRMAERQIKGWSRMKKQALIIGDWESIIKLSRQ